MSSFAQLGQILPTSADFPVQWEDPAQARQLWQLERMHFAEPLLPLVMAVWQNEISPAFNRAADQYRLPIRLYFWPVNGYLYSNYRSVGLPPDWVLRGMNRLDRVAPHMVQMIRQAAAKRVARTYLAEVEPVIVRLQEKWQDDWWPQLQQHLDWWQAFDLNKVTLPQLLVHMENSLERIGRVWEIHFQLIVPCLLALHQFERVYNDCFPQAEKLSFFQLLQGIDNSFLQSERALWQLGRQACTMTTVYQIISEQRPSEALTSLQYYPEGRIFLAELQAFLQKYGRRGQNVDGLGEVSWLEEPSPVLQSLKFLVRQPDRDIKAELQLQTTERNRLVQRAQQQLRDHPQQERFAQLLVAAQTAVYLHEEHNFWIDQQAMYELRQVFLAIGHRLAATAVIKQVSDIFYLLPDEIIAAGYTSITDLKQLIAARQQSMRHFAALTPPAAVGTMPLMLPPENDPLGNAFGKVVGSLIPQPTIVPTATGFLEGQAASPGTVRGPARVIHSVTDADRLQLGDVLVTVATLPPWTSMFGRASAVITETGGILSHAAIVAREVGIPAVVGVMGATTIIGDSQIIEVNGSTGTIRLIKEMKEHR